MRYILKVSAETTETLIVSVEAKSEEMAIEKVMSGCEAEDFQVIDVMPEEREIVHVQRMERVKKPTKYQKMMTKATIDMIDQLIDFVKKK